MQKKVLVVEDSVTLARMISAVLSHADYAIQHAENGDEAIDFIKNGSFDLIMLDLMMPVMDGKEFLHLLRTEYLISTPVLVYTGSQDVDIEEELLNAGANRVLFKPLGAQTLINVVNEHIT